ncbi:hypothetical protein Tco_0359976 [Tanacetum coccineum]
MSISEALGGNTRDLDSIWEETGHDCNFTRSGFIDVHTVPGDGVAIPSDAVRTYKLRRQDLCDSVRTVEEAWEIIEDCAQCNKQWKNPTSTIFDQTIANLKAQLVGNEVVRVKIPKCMSWLEAYDEPIGDLDMMEDKEDNQSPQSTLQVLLSFEVYTPLVTYPKEVKETIGIPIEVEHLNQTHIEDLGLNTCSHDLSPSFREVPSFDEPNPQPHPLTNCPSLDVSLGEERSPEPPIKPHSLDSFRMKEVNNLTIHTPPSPHVTSLHPKDMYSYYHPCIDDPKKHYGFKPGLLGQSGSIGVDFLNLKVIENNFLR